MSIRYRRASVILIAVATATLPAGLSAQILPGFGGVDVRLGRNSPSNDGGGLSAALDLDLGYLRYSVLRTVVGLERLGAGVDRGPGITGSYRAVGGKVGLRADFIEWGPVRPYLGLALTGHNASATVDDPLTEDLLTGFYIGLGFGAGLRLSLDEEQRYGVTADFRKLVASNIGGSQFEVGFRYNLRGTETYDDVVRREAGMVAAIARTRVEEQTRREAEAEARRSAAADSVANARAGQERAEAERQTGDREREQEQARLLEAERQRGQQETQRARDDAAAAQRRADEAEQRQAAAERQAQAAEEARLAADARAAEAEEKLLQSLLDLERVLVNVAGVRDTERGMVITLGNGIFASGAATLNTAARQEVNRIAAVLKEYPGRTVAVEGHTDSEGGENTNQRLSERRAQSVAAALEATGIDPARVQAQGFGESRPTATNENADGRARNRRVEIILVGVHANSR